MTPPNALRAGALLASLLWATSGTAAPPACNIADRKVPTDRAPLSLVRPDAVLDGTELIPLDTLRREAMSDRIAGRYGIEEGGAELTLTITPREDGAWTAERRFAEPGNKPQIARYRLERCGEALVSAKNDIVVQTTREGILVLELASGVESIPAEYWTHYVRKRQ